MGAFADAVNGRLCERLRSLAPEFEWETEHYVAGTPVDVVGTRDGEVVCVELEWRRADPADNTAKLFRHLVEGSLDAERVRVYQLFTGYYDLGSGGVSSKRRNAEFVGRVAARSVPAMTYEPLDLEIDPPKRGGERPTDWDAAVDDAGARIANP
jgi:hypothetical protein